MYSARIHQRRRRRSAAFSLLELLAVLVILGTIATIAIYRVNSSITYSKEKANEINKGRINAAVERYYMVEGVWPANNLSDIGANPNYFPDGVPENPVTGDDYELDPATHRVLEDGGGK